ncbi:MAG: hypothetical protein JWQ14_1891 [Adhaeribacter sp.]|jgi:hypothetical protein|nr:hypothetical protein [Adhaeribacter sp.]
MKKTMATIGVVLMVSAALAQATVRKTIIAAPKKDNHGKRVSEAAHQPYTGTGKGRFMSRIARLKSKNTQPGVKGRTLVRQKTKALRKAQKSPVNINNVTNNPAARPVTARRLVYASKPVALRRSERTGRPEKAG